MAAEGKTASEIGKILSINAHTAELHRGSMLDKLGLRHRTDLVRYAVRRGILVVDS
jgi:two-component system response regulator NreC